MATETENTVIVNEADVQFDTKGRATITDANANAFIKETLNAEGAIEIGQPGALRTDVNVNCTKCATNLYCPPKATAA
jgi:hypothetical protein